MTPSKRRSTGRFLSLVLRHEPRRIGLELDPQGWADVTALLEGLGAAGHPISLATLEEIVRTDRKQRFALSDDRRRIRANQGHSVDVDLGLDPVEPPALLYHGTAKRNVASILETGIGPGERHHVHLSRDPATATDVGQRHGRPVVLEVDSGAMHAAAYVFFRSLNGVWLTEHVPADFIRPPGELRIRRTWDGRAAKPSEHASIAVSLDDGSLELRIDAPFHGDPPPDAPAGRCERLWEHEVVELFLVGPSGRYLEIEVGPHGHYLGLLLAGVREVERDDLRVELTVTRDGARWRADARLDARHVPRPVERWNAFAIHGRSGARRYLAAYPVPGDGPDFHRTHCYPTSPLDG